MTRRIGTVSDFQATLASACEGDEPAISELYRSVAPLVLGYMRANGAASPEDLTGDVFVSVIDGLDRFTGDAHRFRAWVLTIAYRRRVDDLRRQGRRQEDSGLPQEAMDAHQGVDDLEDTALGRLRVRGVIDAMSELTEEQQTVLQLRVLADLPIRDICTITGKTEPAVKALLRRAIAALTRTLVEREAG